MSTSWISFFTLSSFTAYSRMRRIIRLAVLFLSMISLSLGLLPPTEGLAKPRANTVVTANNTAELITRINEANASGDNYTINLVATTYELTAINNSTDGDNGLPSLINTGSLTINGNGATIKRNSASEFRLFHIAAGVNVTLKNLTLESGLARGSDGTGGGGGGAGLGGAIFNRGNLTLEATTLLNNQAIGGAGASGSGGAGGGFNTPASGGGVGTDGSGGAANGNNGDFGSGGGSGGTGGYGSGGNGDAAGGFGTAGSGGQGGSANGGGGGFGAGGGPGGTGGLGGGGGGGGGQGAGAVNGEAGNVDDPGFGGDGGNGSSGFGNGSGGTGGRGGNATGGTGGFGGGGGRAGTAGTGGGGGGGAPNGSGGNPGSGGSNGSGGIVGGGGARGNNGTANGGTGGFGGGAGHSTTGGGGGGFGGAVFNYLGTVVLINTTFYNNTAQGGSGANGGGGFGGAFFNYQGTVTATNATLSHNTVLGDTSGTDGQQQGGAVYNYQGNLTLTNNILANSSGDNDCQNNGGMVTAPSENRNLIESHIDCDVPTFTSDPLLSTLGAYGGNTQTLGLLPGSPAIDSGDSAACSGALINSLDQRAVARPAACDIGAFESQGFTLTLAGGDNQSTAINTAFANPLQVTVTANDDAEPVGAGGIISFTAPDSGASLTSASFTALTDAGGVASAPVTANSTTGSYQVAATANGVSSTLNFNLTNTLADLILSKSVSPAMVGPGDILTFTLTFTNIGGATASSITLSDLLPTELSGLAYEATGDAGVSITATAGLTYEWTVSDLLPNQGGVITVTTQADNNLSVGMVFTNTATIQTTSLESDSTNNLSQVSITTCLSTITVTNANDSGGGSLRQAIIDVCEGGTIDFDNDYTIYLNSTLSINKGLTIDGSGHTITVSGDSGNDGDRDVQVFKTASSNGVTLNALRVVSGTATEGGGLYNDGKLTISNSVFSGNNSQYGGGINNDFSGDLNLLNSIVSGNTAEEGGGIRNLGGKAVVMNSTLNGNLATYGGGILNGGATLRVINSTLSGNSATEGGGVFSSGVMTLINNTVSGNSATEGGGIYNINDMHLKNNLIANNGSGGDCYNDNDLLTNTNNLIEDGSCSPALSGDPRLASLGNYGGLSLASGEVIQTLALLPGSPAIDAGDSATCSGAEVDSLDQRGVTRPSACDIGAFESQGFTLAISGGNNQSAGINTAFTNPLQVKVTANNNTEPVGAGGLISFTAPGSGASLSSASFTATTNASGVASAIVTANSTAGSYGVTATARGISNAVNFNLTNNQANAPIYLPLVFK